MGKRSRKRVEVEASPTSRAQRDAARARRAAAAERSKEQGARSKPKPGRTSIDDRPPAPWGSFPLVELVVLLALILLVAGFIVRGERGATMVIGGLALGSLAGIELSIREHFGGFRSHTTLLAAVTAFAAGALTYVITRDRTAPIIAAAVVCMPAFWIYRQVFTRRTGGVGVRR